MTQSSAKLSINDKFNTISMDDMSTTELLTMDIFENLFKSSCSVTAPYLKNNKPSKMPHNSSCKEVPNESSKYLNPDHLFRSKTDNDCKNNYIPLPSDEENNESLRETLHLFQLQFDHILQENMHLKQTVSQYHQQYLHLFIFTRKIAKKLIICTKQKQKEYDDKQNDVSSIPQPGEYDIGDQDLETEGVQQYTNINNMEQDEPEIYKFNDKTMETGLDLQSDTEQ